MFTMMLLRMIIMAPIMAVGGVIMALQQDAKLTWVLAVVIPIIAVVIALTAGRALPLFRAIQAKIDRINLVLREGLAGRARDPRLQPRASTKRAASTRPTSTSRTSPSG